VHAKAVAKQKKGVADGEEEEGQGKFASETPAMTG